MANIILCGVVKTRKYLLILIMAVAVPFLSFEIPKCYGANTDDTIIYQEVIRDHCRKVAWVYGAYRRHLILNRTVIDANSLPFIYRKVNRIDELRRDLFYNLYPLLSVDMVDNLQNECQESLDEEIFHSDPKIQLINEEQMLSYGKTCKEFVKYSLSSGEEFLAISRVAYSKDKEKALVILWAGSANYYILVKTQGKWEIAQIIGEGMPYC